MTYPFQRTLRSLNGDVSSVQAALVTLVIVALCGLTVWTFGARVPLLKVSTSGRIEPHNAVHRIEPPEAGRVVHSYLELDKQVNEGDLLIEFDAREEQLELEQSEATTVALTRDLTLVKAQIENKEQELGAAARVDEATLREAAAKETESVPRRLLAEHRERLLRDTPVGSVSELEKLERQTEAEELSRNKLTQALGIARLEREQLVRRGALRAQLLLLEREELRISGQLDELKISIARLRYQIDKKLVRAPAGGRLVDVVELGEGAFIAQGTRVGTIVAAGPAHVRVRARFTKDTVGIVQPGQPARLKLDGYPWSIYGTVPARVSRVGTEPGIVTTPEAIPGTVRVELVILQPADPRIVLQHGLTTTVEIEVARISPIELLLRAIGQWNFGEPQLQPRPNEGPAAPGLNIAAAEAR